ncbi:MAG: hypothetical protein VX550_10015 [Bacteroidota bacterium]|nr:hypothetical protein [Bacteroidota bacterium]
MSFKYLNRLMFFFTIDIYVKFFILLFLLFSTSAFAQGIIVKGVVYDEVDLPLPFSSVIYQSSTNKHDTGFGITDTLGMYQLKLKKGQRYKLEIKSLGFKPLVQEIVAQSSKLLQHRLQVAPDTLKEIIVKADIRPIIDNDSLRIYNVDKFNKGNEKKLKDVLRNLPGIQVNEKGDVYFEGKKVNSINVEGEKFFIGGTRLASSYLPSHVISAIEVLKNAPSIIDPSVSDRITLNVKLKRKNSKFWFGDFTTAAGIGGETRYLLSPLVFYYSKSTRFNTINKFSNNGETPFTLEDYINYKGGLKTLINDYESINFKTNLLRSDYNRLSFYDEDIFTVNNINQKLKNELKIESNLLIFNNYSLMRNNSFIQYNDASSNEESRSANTISNGHLIDFNVIAQKEFKRSNTLNLNLTSRNEFSENEDLFISSFADIRNSIFQNIEDDTQENRIKLDYSKKWKNTMRLNAAFIYLKNELKKNISLLSTDDLLNNRIESNQPFDQAFDFDSDRVVLNTRLSNLINSKVKFSLGIDSDRHKSNATLFLDNNADQNNVSAIFTANTLAFKPYVNLKGSYKDFYFKVNSSFMYYSINNNQNALETFFRDTQFPLKVSLNYSPSRNIDYSINLSHNIFLPDHLSLYQSERVTNFNTVVMGNANLKAQRNLTYSSYFNYQPKLGRNYSLSIKYDIIRDAIRQSINVDRNNVVFSYLNLANPEKQLSVDFSYFSNQTADSSFRLNLSNTRISSVNIINDIPTDVSSVIYNLESNWLENWNSLLSTDTHLQTAYNQIESDDLNRSFYSFNVSNTFVFNIIKYTSFKFNSSSIINFNGNENFQFLNISNLFFNYTPIDSMFEYGLDIRNIWNYKDQLNFQNGISSVVRSSRRIQPRTISIRASVSF